MISDKERIQAAIDAIEDLLSLQIGRDMETAIDDLIAILKLELKYPYNDPACVCKSCGRKRPKETSAAEWEHRGGMCGPCWVRYGDE